MPRAAARHPVDRFVFPFFRDFGRRAGLTVGFDTGTPGSGAESFAIVKCIKLILDDYANEQLIEYRPFIWKTLLENSRDMVQTLRNSEAGNFERANCATKVRSSAPFPRSFFVNICVPFPGQLRPHHEP
jgi:hypothetical protein